MVKEWISQLGDLNSLQYLVNHYFKAGNFIHRRCHMKTIQELWNNPNQLTCLTTAMNGLLWVARRHKISDPNA